VVARSEVDRYVLPGDTTAFVHLRLAYQRLPTPAGALSFSARSVAAVRMAAVAQCGEGSGMRKRPAV
jgi:hypothetical protein